ESVGFKTAIAVEVNKTAIKTIKLNRPKLPIIEKRIEDVSADEILQRAGISASDVCIVTGGPCCQSFSTVGKRESISDHRGSLFRHFKRIVKDIRPRFFVMENVKGILSAAVRHRPLDDRGPGNPPLARDEEFGSALRVIERELGTLSYYIVIGLLNCADYGVPQKRLRVVFLGSRDGESIALPETTHSEGRNNGKLPWVTLREAIKEIRETHPEHTPFSEDRRKFLSLLRAGQNWMDLPKRMQKEALGEAYNSWGGRSGFCRRLDWDLPAPTLTTSPTGRATTLCHPTRLRPLTVTEYAELQQFPSNWQFAGSTTQKYIQIGNAVPTGLGKAMGKMFRAAMSRSARNGLGKARKKRGVVEYGDSELGKRLKRRPKTKLHPPRFRKDPDPEAARKWLESTASKSKLSSRRSKVGKKSQGKAPGRTVSKRKSAALENHVRNSRQTHKVHRD
ncbi:MAG: DNA cytosine methyltransferase, partial [Pyrinomonadaceae bacterium]